MGHDKSVDDERVTFPMGWYRPALTLVVMALVVTALYAAFMWAPEGEGFQAKLAQRIFYFHVASAWVSYVAFGVVLTMSGVVLWKESELAHEMAGAGAEIGIIFCTAAILMGMLWGNQEWGVPWRWEEAKLTVTFVLWIIYIAYIAVRSEFTGSRGRKRLALFGILAFVCVPLSFGASRWWEYLHPNPVGAPGGLSPAMGMTLGFSVIAMTFTFYLLYLLRFDTIKMKMEIEELKLEAEELTL